MYGDGVILIDEGTTTIPAGAKLEKMVKGYVALSQQRNQIILFIFHASSDVEDTAGHGCHTSEGVVPAPDTAQG